MRDPLASENPYRAGYGAWDLWCYRNVRDYEGEDVVAYYAGEHPDWVNLDSGVDKDGWIIPQTTSIAEGMEYSLGYYPRYADASGCAASLFCIGPMDDEVKAGLLELRSRMRAAYVLPVPQWLVDAPPRVAKFIPDGRFAIQGELGSGSGIDAVFFGMDLPPDWSTAAWNLYSADGELLSTGEPGELWWQLCFPDFVERTGVDPTDENAGVWEYGGVISAYDPETYEPAFAFTYDGQELADPNANRPDIDPRAQVTLFGPEIPLIQATQQKIELRQPCGMGIGVDDPAELDQSLIIAAGNSPTSYAPRFINVKPLDDPGNPYAGKYADWDRWIYDNHLLLCREYGYNNHIGEDTYAAVDPTQRAYDAANGEVHPVPGARFDLGVDDQGWLIPYAITQELEYSYLTGTLSEEVMELTDRFYCMFHVVSFGNMDQEMFSAYQAVMYQVKAGVLPEIPAWLADNPPLSLRFLPTGAYITYGELGTVTDTYDLPWVYYSSEGKELGRSPSGTEWWELTFPGFADVVIDLGGKEAIEYSEWHGIIELTQVDGEEYAPIAVYSYTGVQMDNADYGEPDMYFEYVPGEFLPAMRESQLGSK